MNLYLVRHAKPEDNVGDTPLGTEGLEQAGMLGELFKGLNPPRERLKLLSSSANRARQTAEVICDRLGMPLQEIGTFPTPFDNNPNSDLSQQLLHRLRQMTANEGHTEIIVVGHWDYIGKTIAWLLGNPAFQLQNIYGATICFECQPPFNQGEGNLKWLITPQAIATPPHHQPGN